MVTPKWSVLLDGEYAYLQVPDVLVAGRCFADALQELFGLHPSAVHVCSCPLNTCNGGAMSRAFSPLVTHSYVDVPNRYKLFEWLFLQWSPPTSEARVRFLAETCQQGVTKRCPLSLLTNSALLIQVQMRGEGGSCGVSANENSCAHHVTWSPNKLWRSTSIFNLWMSVSGPLV